MRKHIPKDLKQIRSTGSLKKNRKLVPFLCTLHKAPPLNPGINIRFSRFLLELAEGRVSKFPLIFHWTCVSRFPLNFRERQVCWYSKAVIQNNSLSKSKPQVKEYYSTFCTYFVHVESLSFKLYQLSVTLYNIRDNIRCRNCSESYFIIIKLPVSPRYSEQRSH